MKDWNGQGIYRINGSRILRKILGGYRYVSQQQGTQRTGGQRYQKTDKDCRMTSWETWGRKTEAMAPYWHCNTAGNTFHINMVDHNRRIYCHILVNIITNF
jgi:hypothetical protein